MVCGLRRLGITYVPISITVFFFSPCSHHLLPIYPPLYRPRPNPTIVSHFSSFVTGILTFYLTMSLVFPALHHTFDRSSSSQNASPTAIAGGARTIRLVRGLNINRSIQLSPEEQKAVINAFVDPTSTQASGFRLAGQKYFTLQVNDRSIYGKKQVRFLSHTILFLYTSLYITTSIILPFSRTFRGA